MKKLLTAFFLLFLALAYGTVTGAHILGGTAYAKAAKPKPHTGGPDDTDDGSGSGGGSNGGPDDTHDDGGCGGGGSDSGGGADPDGSGGGTDF